MHYKSHLCALVNNSFTQLVCTIAHKLNTFPFIFFFPLGKQIDTEKSNCCFRNLGYYHILTEKNINEEK